MTDPRIGAIHACLIIGIAVFAAVITPTQDVLTLMLLAGPLYVLYEICIWLAYFMEKKDRSAYPEYYAELEKDEAALEKESPPDEWDKEDYNPWDQSGSDEEDEDYKRSKNLASQEKTDASEDVSGEPSAELERSAESEPAADDDAKVDEVKPEGTDDSERKNPD